MAGQRESVAAVMRSIVDFRRLGETNAPDDENAEYQGKRCGQNP